MSKYGAFVKADFRKTVSPAANFLVCHIHVEEDFRAKSVCIARFYVRAKLQKKFSLYFLNAFPVN